VTANDLEQFFDPMEYNSTITNSLRVILSRCNQFRTFYAVLSRHCTCVPYISS